MKLLSNREYSPILFTVLILCQCLLLGAAPLLPFQGSLSDGNGNPIPDGERVVQFKIYNAPIGGAVEWAGEVHRLSVNGGLVNTILGSQISLSASSFNRPQYLEITVDADRDGAITASDPPLLPRQVILPAIFALESDLAQSARGLMASDGTPYDWSVIFKTNDPSSGFDWNRVQSSSVPPDRLGSGISFEKFLPRKLVELPAAHRPGDLLLGPVMNQTILGPKLKQDGVVELDNGSVTITTRGGAVEISLIPATAASYPRPIDRSGIGLSQYPYRDVRGTPVRSDNEATLALALFRSSEGQSAKQEAFSIVLGTSTAQIHLPPGVVNFVDMPPAAGTYTYSLSLTYLNPSGSLEDPVSCSINQCRLMVEER